MTVVPAQFDAFVMYQGATFDEQLLFTNDAGDVIDLTGCQAQMQIRNRIDNTLISDISTTNNGMVITPGEGRINFSLTPTQTESIIADTYNYGFRLTNTARKDVYLRGTLKVFRAIVS